MSRDGSPERRRLSYTPQTRSGVSRARTSVVGLFIGLRSSATVSKKGQAKRQESPTHLGRSVPLDLQENLCEWGGKMGRTESPEWSRRVTGGKYRKPEPVGQGEGRRSRGVTSRF